MKGRKIKTVLVVDNNQTIVEMIADYLHQIGYRVEKAYDGVEALKKARKSHPDVIILDLIMPRIDGMRVCRYIKQDNEVADIPVVILSGTAAEEQIDITEIGAQAFVAKRRFPEMIANLVAVLESLETVENLQPSNMVIGKENLYPRELVRELLDVKHHYDTLMNVIEDGVAEIDARGRILFINSATLRYLECVSCELIGQPVTSLFSGEEKQRFKKLLYRLENNPANAGMLKLKVKHRTLKIKAVPLTSDGNYDGALMTIQDVTAEAVKARNLETLNRRIIQNVPLGIGLIDPNGIVRTVNPTLAGWFGTEDPASIVGENIFAPRWMKKNSLPMVIRTLFEKSGKGSAEMVSAEKDPPRIFRILVSPGGGELRGYKGRIVIVEDETDRVLLHRRLAVINKELLVANQTKSNFLSMISHELRTPLTIVEGYLALLLDGSFGNFSEKVTEVLKVSKERAGHLHNLIEELLDVSRIEAGRFFVKMGPVPLKRVLDRLIAEIREKDHSKEISLTFNPANSRPVLLSEIDKVDQVLSNLIENAIKFSCPDGEISVRVNVPAEKKKNLSGKWETVLPGPKDLSNYCDIEVRDEGVGVDPSHLSKLFKIFSQVESGIDRPFAGSGIGLFIVREIVEHHRGRILAWSNSGEGFAVRVSLPLDTPVNRGHLKSYLSGDEIQKRPGEGTGKIGRGSGSINKSKDLV